MLLSYPVQGVQAVGGAVHLVAAHAQGFAEELQDGFLVVHHQDTTLLLLHLDLLGGRAGSVQDTFGTLCRGRTGFSRQFHHEDGLPATPAGHADGSAVILNDTVTQREPQTGAHIEFFGGEERLEDPVADVLRNPGTVVREADHDAILDAAAGHGEDPTSPGACHGLVGIVQQVDEYLLQLV